MWRVRASSRSSRDWPRDCAWPAPVKATVAVPRSKNCRSIICRPGPWERRDNTRRSGHLGAAFAPPRAASSGLWSGRGTVVAIDGAAAHDGGHDAALHRALVERRVLGLAAELVAIDLPGIVGVEHHEVGRRAPGALSARQPEQSRRRARQQLEQAGRGGGGGGPPPDA